MDTLERARPTKCASCSITCRHIHAAHSTKPSQRPKRTASSRKSNSTTPQSTPAGSTWSRSRSACCAASAWIGASQIVTVSSPRSLLGSVNAMPSAPGSTGCSRPSVLAPNWPVPIQRLSKIYNLCAAVLVRYPRPQRTGGVKDDGNCKLFRRAGSSKPLFFNKLAVLSERKEFRCWDRVGCAGLRAGPAFGTGWGSLGLGEGDCGISEGGSRAGQEGHELQMRAARQGTPPQRDGNGGRLPPLLFFGPAQQPEPRLYAGSSISWCPAAAAQRPSVSAPAGSKATGTGRASGV